MLGAGSVINRAVRSTSSIFRLLIGGKKFAYHSSGGSIYRQWSDLTVCKRDVPEVHRRRLEIERKLEEFLSSTGQLTPARLRAISRARSQDRPECLAIRSDRRRWDNERRKKLRPKLLADRRGRSAPLQARISGVRVQFCRRLSGCNSWRISITSSSGLSMSSPPLFSVIIPTYDRLELLKRALQSVKEQSFSDYEIVVVDDGSKDGTSEWLAENRVLGYEKYGNQIRVPALQGMPACRTTFGEYCACLDSDDVWFPWTLDIYRDAIERFGRPAFLAGKPQVFSEETDLVPVKLEPPRHREIPGLPCIRR